MKQLLSILASGCVAVSAAFASPFALTLDTAKTNAPINPFIYGQFIEHMGRCIYGGIWAEMLEDRKFYFPITANYSPYKDLVDSRFPVVGASPWQIIGSADSVTMEKKDAFVGNHSPRIEAGSGVRQRDLALVSGRRYEGYVWVKALSGAAEIEVALVPGENASHRDAVRLKFRGNDYSKKAFNFTAQESSGGGMLEIRVLRGTVLLGPPSLMPADNVNGLRADTLALLKELNGTVYRWPGGNFVSGYDWRDGIGDRDRRPPRKNPAWTGVEHNDFGTDEFIAFCREIGTEPMIAVNTGFGDAYSAAQWVEYCNASTKTIGGGWRAKNGSKSPYNVKYWCVGNEMFGPWQLGFMQMEHYTLKHKLVAEAMWKVDPKAVLVGVGDLTTINKEHDPNQVKSGKTCSHIMLEECADHMNMLSEHFYCGRVPWKKEIGRTNLLGHVVMLRDAIREKADGHRKLQTGLTNLQGRIVPIAMDEWNYWHREYAYGELGCIYELQDGLGVAAGLHEFFRQSDLIQMAHYAQTVNVIGAIKTTKTAAELETTGLMLLMYRRHFGQIPLRVEQRFGDADVAAALTQDGKFLTIGVVNPSSSEMEFQPKVSGLSLRGPAVRWHVSGPSPESHNTPGQPRVVDIHKTDGSADSQLRVPPLSAAVFRIPLE